MCRIIFRIIRVGLCLGYRVVLGFLVRFKVNKFVVGFIDICGIR